MVREALAFDMYGTLVNPIRIWQQLEQYIPQNGIRGLRCSLLKEVS